MSGFTRRHFMKVAGAGAVLAAAQERGRAQAGGARIAMALVGCAHIHVPQFIKLLKARPDVSVKWVWDHDAARAEARAGELGARVAKSAEQVWADGDVRAAVVASETDRHRDLVLAGAKAGKHLFVEKPLGVSASESREMADAIEKAGVLFTTGYFMRTNPEHLFLKDQVAAGAFGTITRAEGWNCHAGSLKGWFDTDWRWMADPARAGVGAFGDLGTHSLDILMWLLGDVASVAADIRVITKRYGACDETGQALIKFRSGASGALTAGWVDVANPVSLMIAGTGAHAAVVNGQLFFRCEAVKGADGKTPWTQLPAKPPLPLDQFADAVAGAKDRPLVPVRDAAARVVVMEAMYRAAREKRWVEAGS